MTNQPEEQSQKLRELLLKLGQSYFDRNRFQDAFEKLSQLVALEPANEQALLLATKASIALENISDDGLSLYRKALDSPNIDSDTCEKIQVLLDGFELESEVVSEINQKLSELNFDTEEDVKEETKSDEVIELIQPQKSPETQFVEEIENLWWESQFDQAIKTIDKNTDFEETFLVRLRILTEAYQCLSKKEKANPKSNFAVNCQQQLENLKPESLHSIKDIILLMYALPEEMVVSEQKVDDMCESEFILGKIAIEDYFHLLQKEPEKQPTNSEILNHILFEELRKADGWVPENEEISFNWTGFLTTSLSTVGGTAPSDKVLNLVADYLYKIPKSILRFTEDGFLSFAENPLKQVKAVLNLYKSISEYNKAADPGNQIILSTSIITEPKQKDAPDHQSFKLSVLKSLHLLKKTQTNAQPEHCFHVQCEKELLNEIKQIDENIKASKVQKLEVLPGIKSDCFEITRKVDGAEHETSPEIQDLKILEKLESKFPFSTYLTKNMKLERSVILKTISYKKEERDTEKQKEIILSNIKKLGRLNHPNIATLFDMGENREQVYYTREYVEGDNILSIDKSEADWEINFCITIEKIIRALLVAGNDSISHLNLKPSNIRINEAKTLKLTDFDVFQSNTKNKRTSEIKSTKYLAPEVIQSGNGDCKSDIYSIGLLAYEILTGESPYTEMDNSKNGSAIKLNFEMESGEFHKGWIDILKRATDNNPKNRFQTLNELEIEIKKVYLELSTTVEEV